MVIETQISKNLSSIHTGNYSGRNEVITVAREHQINFLSISVIAKISSIVLGALREA